MVAARHPNAPLSPQHDGKPFCHKPCYATLFGPKGMSVLPLCLLRLCPGLQEGPGPPIPAGRGLQPRKHPRSLPSMG